MKTARVVGYTLIEALVTLTIVMVASSLTLPGLLRLSAGQRVDLAAAEIVGVLRLARTTAVRLGANVAVRFVSIEGERVSYRLYADGDGDGVLSRDIESGVDPPLGFSRQLIHLSRRMRLGIPEGPVPRDPGDPRRRLGNLRDPIRLNRSDLASFNPFGGSTPGSLYLTDGLDHLAVVRIFGRTGKVKAMTYDFEEERWR